MRASPRTLALLLSTSLILASGCSKHPDDTAAPANEAAATSAVDASATDAAAGAPATTSELAPGIANQVAPGVAFAYRYAFTLPADAISGMQRQHSDACGKLGPSQCRVTGMSYEQPREGEVSARLDFLLAPDIAQQFGSDAVGLVEKAEGRLANANVSGENAGGAIDISQQQSANLLAELARLETRLKSPGLSAEERRELTQRSDAMRGELTGQKDLRRQKEAAIATTPVSFAYDSQGLFNTGSNPFGTAAEASLGSMSKMLAVVVTLAGILLPWLLLAGLIALTSACAR